MRTVFLIDGFNFYYSIKYFNSRLKWFNYRDFCLYFLRKSDINFAIYYFKSLALWVPNSVIRHNIFIEAL
jgi:hypothetical protein